LRESLKTAHLQEAEKLVHARNEADQLLSVLTRDTVSTSVYLRPTRKFGKQEMQSEE